MSGTAFKFPAYRHLKLSIGSSTAAVANAELAVRLMNDKALQAQHPDVYIQALSQKYGIRVDKFEMARTQLLTRYFFIVSVHQQFEAFLGAFKREHPKQEWPKDMDESLFESVLRVLFKGLKSGVAAIGKDQFALVDYYRLVRNSFIHAPAAGPSTADLAVPQLTDEVRAEYASLLAPNPPNAITFDDFILFSRVVLAVAEKLCRLGRPSDEEIALTIKTQYQSLLVPILTGGRSVERGRRALRSLLRTRYSLGEFESDRVISILFTDR